MSNVPNYLADYEAIWKDDPHQANLEWFRDARFGLFIHYGLYSSLGVGEWAQYHQRIPVSDYEKLKDTFTAGGFDAGFVTDLALEAQMKYVNLVTCHHDSFCLWNSKTEPFNSVNSPAGRDLVAEMAEQCSRKGLGFFAYYTYALNWRHPYYLSRDYFFAARPEYEQPEPRYRFSKTEDFQVYLDYAHSCIEELLTGYGPLAGMWLDLIMAYYAQPDLIAVGQTYEMIRSLQPHTLISYKQGATGEEDFASTESSYHSLEEQTRERVGDRAAAIARNAWEKNREKHNEVVAPLQRGGWGYRKDAQHMTADDVWELLSHATANNCNLCVNVGPLPDGEIHPQDVETLREVGQRIRREGWPVR